MRTLIVGGTGRLGIALTEQFKARGDEVFPIGRKFDSLPEALNYVVFCQRYRGEESISGEFDASVAFTNGIMQQLGFADEGDCSVVMVASVFGVAPGPGNNVGYHVGKAAEIALAKYHAATLGLAARVNSISPWGFTSNDPPIQMQEVVNVIEFLCSPKSSGINGQNIIVDKGRRGAWAW